MQTLDHGGAVNSVAFSHDSRYIVSGSWDHTIKVWDTASGACMQTLGHGSGVWSVAFSYNSQHIVSGSWDSTIKVWNTASGAYMQTLEGHGGGVYSVAFSYDGRHIVSGSHDNTMKVWDTASGACMQTLGHGGAVYSVAFSHDGRHIVSGSHDSTIKVWNTASGACMQTLEGHGSGVNSVAFSYDGQYIVSGSHDNTIKVWDTASGACTQTLKVDRVVSVVALDTSDTSNLRVLTEIGWLDLGTGKHTSHSSMLPENQNGTEGENACYRDDGDGPGYSLSTDKRWIRWHEQNVLWLPSDYRPSNSVVWSRPSHASTASSNGLLASTVALGCGSGRVIVMGLADYGSSH
jgi:WD40 repeat protein